MALTSWPIDPAHSSIRFTVRHLVISKVRGRFKRWQAELMLDEQDLSSSRVDVSIDAATIDTGDESRDAYLRSPELLDVGRYPTITFRTTGVARQDKGALAPTGDLTIRDVTRSVTLMVESPDRGQDPGGNPRITFNGKATILREAFGATWNGALETGGFLVGKQVDVELTLQAVGPDRVVFPRAGR